MSAKYLHPKRPPRDPCKDRQGVWTLGDINVMPAFLRSRVLVVVAVLAVCAPIMAISLPSPPPVKNHGDYAGTAVTKLKRNGKVVQTRKGLENLITVNGAGTAGHANNGADTFGFDIQAAGIITNTATSSKGQWLGSTTTQRTGKPPQIIGYKGAGTATYKTNSKGKRTVSFIFSGKRVNKPSEVLSYTGKGVRP